MCNPRSCLCCIWQFWSENFGLAVFCTLRASFSLQSVSSLTRQHHIKPACSLIIFAALQASFGTSPTDGISAAVAGWHRLRRLNLSANMHLPPSAVEAIAVNAPCLTLLDLSQCRTAITATYVSSGISFIKRSSLFEPMSLPLLDLYQCRTAITAT